MFTGIIEEIGCVKSLQKIYDGALLSVKCSKVLQGTNVGDSICVNGVCTTVKNIDTSSFTVDISRETLTVSNLGSLKNDDSVNLERALTLNSRLGGHIVSGHVDCTGKLINSEKLSDFYNLVFEIPQECMKYVVYKGSITINGISLTVADVRDDKFNVAVIPHTFGNTNLKNLKIGDTVNIETDILGRYVEKILSANHNDNKNSINYEFLQENGFV